MENAFQKNKPYYIVTLVIITLAVFGQAVQFGFTNWDDEVYILNNKFIKDFSWLGFQKMCTATYAGNYHPVVTFFNAVEYALFGTNPMIYHFMNIFFHVVNTILVMLLVFDLSKKSWVAFGVAMIFAIHPLHVESVAWVSESKDVLYTLFMLLAARIYIQSKQDNRKSLPYICIALFILACLSKSSAVVFPLLMVMLDYYLDVAFDLKKSIINKWMYWIIALGFGLLALYTQKQEGAIIETTQQYDLLYKLVIPCYALSYYIIQFFIPFHQSALHPFPETLGVWHYASVVFLGALVLLIWKFRKNKNVVFGAAFFIINLLLVIQVLGFGKAIVSERYSYVPYIGLAFLVCMLLDTIQSKSSQLKYGLIPFVVLLMVISYNRIKVWEDSIALFSDVTEKYPTSAIGWNNLGTALYRADKMDDGLDALNEAIKLNPSYAEAYNNRGAFFLKTNNFVSAEPDFIKATTLRKNYSTAFYNLGVLYSKTGKVEKAIDNFKISIAQNNDAQSAYYNMAICYNQLGDKKAALDAVKNAIALKPSDGDAITLQNSIMQATAAPQIKATTDTNTGDKFSKNMAIQQNAAGKNLMAANNPEKAIEAYSKAIEYDPQFAEAYNNRGAAYGKLKNYQSAILDFTKAIQINSQYAMAFKNRGMAYNKIGQKENACSDWSKAAALGNQSAAGFLEQNCR